MRAPSRKAPHWESLRRTRDIRRAHTPRSRSTRGGPHWCGRSRVARWRCPAPVIRRSAQSSSSRPSPRCAYARSTISMWMYPAGSLRSPQINGSAHTNVSEPTRTSPRRAAKTQPCAAHISIHRSGMSPGRHWSMPRSTIQLATHLEAGESLPHRWVMLEPPRRHLVRSSRRCPRNPTLPA